MAETLTASNAPRQTKSAAGIKVPPHSIEAEQSLLGGVMIDPQAWDRVSDRVQESDFYRANHRTIFRAITSLVAKNRPLDVLTVSDALKGVDDLDNAGGEVYLFELAKNIPTAANITAYADIVRERSILRQLIGVAGDISELAFNPQGREGHEVLDEAEQKVFEIAEQGQRNEGPVGIKSLLTSAMERIDTLYHSDDPITGLPTGFRDFDEMTSGLQASDLIIVAGRPSMGKTVFGVNMAENAAIQTNKPVLIYSLEMPGDAIAMRMLSSLGRIDQHKLRTGKLRDEDWPRLTSALSLLADKHIYIDDTPGLTPGEMRSRARRLAREHGQLGLIVVDYLQLMRVPGHSENRAVEISEISRSLKMLAKELKVPVIALSQLNRSLESRTDRRPVMSDLRESGAIEQDADVIAFIYRDEVYNDDTPDKGIAEIIIGKQRNGPIGKIRLAFFGRYTRFDNLSRDEGYVGMDE